ncbi:MAG: CHAT domain-containing protein [Dysgonomonas sp.]
MNTLKFFISLILLLPATICFAQTSNDSTKKLLQEGDTLYEKAHYADAENTYNEAIRSLDYNNTKEYKDYCAALNGLGNIYSRRMRFEKADSLYKSAIQVLRMRKDTCGIEYARTLNSLCRLSVNSQKLTDVDKLTEQSIEIITRIKGEKNLDYTEALINLGYYKLFKGKFAESLELLMKAAKIRLDLLGNTNPKFAESLQMLGTFFYSIGDNKEAEGYYNAAINVAKQTLEGNHPDCFETFLALTTVYASTGRYDESMEILNAVLPVVEVVFGKEHPDYAGGLSNLGAIYFIKGDYSKAEPILKESLELTDKVFGEGHSYYFNALNMLALLYLNIGFYDKAELMLVKSLELRKKIYGENHPDVANAMNSLTMFYVEMGNYLKAIPLQTEALKMTASTIGKNTESYAVQLNNMASMLGFDVKALPYLEEAAEIQKKLAGEDNHYYLSIISNIAAIYLNDKTKGKEFAEQYALDVLSRKKSAVGENSYHLLGLMNNLANFYNENGDYQKAHELYKETLNIAEQTYGENNYSYITLLSNTGYNYEKAGNQVEAEKCYIKAIGILKERIISDFAFLSENERFMQWHFKKTISDYISFYAYKRIPYDPSLATLMYDNELFTKNLLLNSSSQIRRLIAESKDEELSGLWEKARLMKTKVAQVLSRSIDDYSEIEDIDKQSQALEKDIIRKSSIYSDFRQQFSSTWQSVEQSLDSDEAAVEFVTFQDMDFWTSSYVGEKLYAALVLQQGYEYPEMVFLCNEEQLKDAILQSGYTFERVYPLVWKPLEKHLKNIKEIYISPAGLLHGVTFPAMKDDGKYLFDKYVVHNLLSTKDISKIKERRSNNLLQPAEAVIVGGADYDLPEQVLLETDYNLRQPLKPSFTRSFLDDLNNTRGQGFSYLSGSKTEVKAIDSLFTAKNWQSILLLDKEATETRLKAVLDSVSPQFLHISTHGFYFLQPDSASANIYKMAQDPLVRSGLVFSGANRVWNGGEPVDGLDDGILTAYEISDMNLLKTQLVVLSACDTGLGDISRSEGVFGLQRAFRLAGTKSMIVSLWKVPDQETEELMTRFYANLLDKKLTVIQAFSKTRNEMKAIYPQNPEKWAGFILIE